MTTTTLNPTEVTTEIDGKQVRESLPAGAAATIRHLLENVMVSAEWHGPAADVLAQYPKELAGVSFEWVIVYDTLSKLIDPDYDDGWREVEENR